MPVRAVPYARARGHWHSGFLASLTFLTGGSHLTVTHRNHSFGAAERNCALSVPVSADSKLGTESNGNPLPIRLLYLIAGYAWPRGGGRTPAGSTSEAIASTFSAF